MKSAVETLNPTRVRLSIEVPFEELKDSLDAAYKKINQQVTVKGFRKGKIPARVIDQRFGRGAVLEEAVNDALPKFYTEAINEADVVISICPPGSIVIAARLLLSARIRPCSSSGSKP